MPIITVNKKQFFELLNRETIDDSDLEEKIFNFGLELEKDEENEENVRIEIPANRYDLLSVEGLSMSFGKFLDTEFKNPEFKIIKNPNPEIMINKFSSKKIRHVALAGILRGVKFNEKNYNSFIDLQDKLHHNLGRRRTIVSIGTHDLKKIEGPFTYSAEKPEDIKFIPLNQTKLMNGREIIEFYKSDNQIKKFLHIIEKSDCFPVIKDKNGTVLSLPPLINSDHSKISLDTKDVFIEITATDLTKANIGLKNILCAFSLYSETKYSFELVTMKEEINENGEIKEFDSPIFEENKQKVATNLKYLNRMTGVDIKDNKECISYLEKMGFKCKELENKDIEFTIPINRSDILHPCDIAEDWAISYGYNNIEAKLPDINTNGRQQTLNKITDLLRHEMSFAGYTECLTFALCSKDDLTTNLLKKEDPLNVVISNPKTELFQVGRTTLLPGLLKTLSNNKKNKLPIKLFEISDVVHLDESTSTGAKNIRNISALITKSKSAGLGKTHGVLDFIFTKLGLKNYELKESDYSEFVKNLQGEIIYNNKVIGRMGILNPDVLLNYNWNQPTSFIELNLEELL